MNQYLTAGKFALLCGVSKDTIFFYDQIGLLSPDFIAENGYRYYSPKQVMIFEIISTLKIAGMSLKEIKEYSAKQDTEGFLDLLEEKRVKLMEMQQQLAEMQQFVEGTMGTIKKILQVSPGEIYEEQYPEEFLVVTPPPSSDDMNDENYWLAIQNLAERANEKDMGKVFPVGEVVLGRDFSNGKFVPTYYCSKPVKKTSSDFILTKPAGLYAVTYHRGNYKTLPQAYGRLKDYIEKHHLDILGDVFEQDQIYPFSKEDPYTYLLKVSVRIK